MRVLDVRAVADVVLGRAGHHHGVAGGEDVGLVGADAHHLRVVVADGLQAGAVSVGLDGCHTCKGGAGSITMGMGCGG